MRFTLGLTSCNLVHLNQSGDPDFGGADALCFMVGSGEDAPVYSKSLALQTWLLGYEFPDTIIVVTDKKILFLTTAKKGMLFHDCFWFELLLLLLRLINKTMKLAVSITAATLKNFFVPKMLSIIDESKKVKHVDLSTQMEDSLTDEAKSKKLKLPQEARFFEESCKPCGGVYDLKPSAASDSEYLYEGTIICSLGVRYKSYCSNIGRTYLINPNKEQEENYKFLCDLQAYLLTTIKEGVLTSDVYKLALDYIDQNRPDLKNGFVKNCGFAIGIEFRESVFLLAAKTSRILKAGMTLNLAIGFQGLENPKATSNKNKTYALFLADTVCVTPNGAIIFEDADKDLDAISYTFGERMNAEQRRRAHQKQLAKARQEEGLLRYSEGKDGEQQVKQAVFKKFESYRKESLIPKNVSDLKIVVDPRSESIILPIFGQAVPFHISTLKNVSKSDEQEFVLLRFNFVTPGQSTGKKDGPTPFEDSSATFVRALSYRSNDIGRLTEICRQINDLKKEMQKKEAEQFLNELVRRFPERPTNVTITQHRILELIQLWNATLCVTSRYKEDFQHINDMYRLLMYKGYRFPELREDAVQSLGEENRGLKTEEELEQEDRKAQGVPFEDSSATFVRALSYRSNDIGRLTEICRQINDLKKEMQKKEAERLETADLVKQAVLNEVKGRKPYRLPEVYVRPGLEGKRFPGDLEIHLNGLRYQSQMRSEQKIDILFSNIKHLFFQPCDGELIVLLHVHLKNPIMVGKKKMKDIQFYREVSDASFDETGNRRRRVNYGDEDELAQEQEERRKRTQLNKEFQAFSERVRENANSGVEVDIPFRDLGFHGVPFRQLVLLQPTTECLVHLTDAPFLVITLSEIEVAHLERVQFGLKNFDLVLVFKDFTRPVVHINTIPVNQLENVKEWLDSVDIPFSEGPVNLSWPQIMRTINDDTKAFFEEAGGWSFLQTEGS
eukprot:jgi/Hompol1/1673/HPOL_002486-RA